MNQPVYGTACLSFGCHSLDQKYLVNERPKTLQTMYQLILSIYGSFGQVSEANLFNFQESPFQMKNMNFAITMTVATDLPGFSDASDTPQSLASMVIKARDKSFSMVVNVPLPDAVDSPLWS